MRQFIAGSCCFIVGLQVLIGVPLMVCLAFYTLTGGGPPSAAFPAYSYPATISPPDFAGAPLPYALPPTPLDGPALAAIAESRDRIGSPLDDSLFESAPPQPAEAEFGAALQTVSHYQLSKPPAVSIPAVSIDDELQAQARKLVELATQLEERGQFQQAARIRELTAAIKHARL